tara:strand:- start:813 stop:1277 length:465 start_codon:yes stop_codon:yes gene_type:complete
MLPKFINEYNFKLAAKIVPDINLKSGYRVTQSDKDLCTNKGVIYLLVNADDEILKIGGSGQTLLDRWVSYQAGTQQARDKGTCSVTNYDVSSYIRDSEENFYLHAFVPPVVFTLINLFGQKKTIQAEVWKEYEKFFLDEFKSTTGDYPLLSKNK